MLMKAVIIFISRLSPSKIQFMISLTDELFQTYIPKTLDDVKHAEEDVQRIISGKDTGEMYYQTITGLKSALSLNNSSQEEMRQKKLNAELGNEGLITAVEPLDGESESETEESDDDSDSEDGSSTSENSKQTPEERKTARKENKKKVKEEKRESRKNKVPKALKKKKKKLAKAKKTR